MIYFISDVHLGVYDDNIELEMQELFLAMLRNIKQNAEKIYLVGDIFDYWFDYKTVIPKKFFRILSAFYDLKKNHCEIEYLMGNHDFGHLDFFEKELNIPVHSGDIEREHYGKRFYISHGDGKDPSDKGYLLLKKVMRNPLSLKLYMKLHPNTGIGLASGSSKESRKYTQKKHYSEGDALFEFAKSKIDEGFDYVIMGHRHLASIQDYKSGKYINIGEWIKEPKIVSFDGNEIKHILVRNLVIGNQ
ncbi:MAG: UDP-2,3-diacylglucosamine diphosphatase [Candidatus Kapabacteria bacterium]|nr:UDP-2,3-diacylglucosamine diphosphatase [Ignavibacteriota bacterium]MCW5884738.1 UDP-2,3-diacylglucosamine diphosphatase [Candidatus Kapabacteria bacterium]